MGFNPSGLLAVLELLYRPSILLPKLVVPDIRALNLVELKKRGVDGVVIDKDNCLTKPKVDSVVKELEHAWPLLVKTFGRENVLVVSNSAGTTDDAGFLQAESVSRHLAIPVLLHRKKKPSCGSAVLDYFAARSDVKGKGRALNPEGLAFVDSNAGATLRRRTGASPTSISEPSTSSATQHVEQEALDSTKYRRRRILVIGDRIMTDVILANRINRLQARKSTRAKDARGAIEAVPVLTTTIWQMEGAGSRVMRALENWTLKGVMRYQRRKGVDSLSEWKACILEQRARTVESTDAKQSIRNPGRPAEIATKGRSSLAESASLPPAQRLRYLFSSLASRLNGTLLRLLLQQQQKIALRTEGFRRELRQLGYGFKAPDSWSRARRFRKQVNEGEWLQSRIASRFLGEKAVP